MEGAKRRRYLRLFAEDDGREVDDELAFHLAARADDLMRQGVPEEEARRRAAAEFGDVKRIRGVLQARRRVRRRRQARERVWQSLLQDVRCALRGLRKRPAMPAVVVATLAVGIGASVMIYATGRALIVEALPFPEADRLVTVERIGEGGRGLAETYGDFVAWGPAVERLATLSAYAQTTSFVDDGARTFRVPSSRVAGDFFGVFGVTPLRGRTIAAAEGFADEPVAVITERLWTTRFGRVDDVVGRPIRIDGRVHTIVGVVPAGFQYPAWIDLWTPLRPSAEAASRSVAVVGRLSEGAGADELRAALLPMHRALDAGRPAAERAQRVDVAVLNGRPNDQAMVAMWLLQCVVLVLLLIAATNAAGLTLTRGIERRRELVVRTSLGASRARIVRHLVVESVLIAAAACALGVLVAHGAIALLRDGLPAAQTRTMLGWDRLGLDGHAVAVALLLATASAVVFGVVPALHVVRDLGVHLRAGAPTATRGRRGSRAARLLLGGEVALALALLLTGGLLTRSIVALRNADPGFDPDGVLAVEWALPPAADAGDDVVASFHDPLLARLEALPGVRSAAIVSNLPMSRTGGWSVRYRPRGSDPAAEPLAASWRPVTPAYLQTMGIALARGRRFTPADGPNAARVTIVSEALARRTWNDGADPIGRQLDVDDSTWTVVGVAGDVRDFGIQQRAEPTLYVPQAQAPSRAGFLALRTAGDPLDLAGPVRGAVRATDPDAAVGDVQPLESMVADFYADERVMAVLMTVFATVSFLTTLVSLYALVAHAVARRRREFGIRIALGARPRHVLFDAMAHAIAWVAAGAVAGLLLAAALARVIAAGLYGVRPLDPAVFTLGPIALLLVAFVASYLPARGATAVSPVETLRGG